MAQISNRVRQQYADAVQLLKEHGVVNTPEWQRVSQVLEKFPVLAVKPAMILLAKRPWIVQRLAGIPTDYSCKEYRFELIGAEELGCLVEALMTKRPTLELQALLGAQARAVADAASEEVRLKAYFAHLTASVWSSLVQAATRSGFDSFYPVSQTMVDCPIQRAIDQPEITNGQWDDISGIQEKLKYLRESMTDYQQKLVEVMRKENETRQVLADTLRDSEAALAIAAAENRIKKYSDLAGFLRSTMGNNHLTVEQKIAEVAKVRNMFTAAWESQFKTKEPTETEVRDNDHK